MKTSLIFAVLCLTLGCSDSSAEPIPAKKDDAPKASVGNLIADGDNANTYRLIEACGFNHEAPDSSRQHADKHFQHIQQTYDKALKKNVFSFYIHADIDDDRGKANINDRQRNEIKTDGKSPAQLVGQEGETMVFKWKMLLPKGFQTTNKFCHLHQLKGIDNKAGNADVGQPLMTLAAYSNSKGGQQLRVRYHNRADGQSSNLAKCNLADLLGNWVEITETCKFGPNGSYAVEVKRINDGKVLLDFSEDNIDMWRTDCTGMRPKWGIYRSLGRNRELQSQLRDEEVRFADFTITKK